MIKPFNGDYPVTQAFNDSCCRASYAKFGMQGHNGIDFGLPCGTPVIAAFNGTIYSGFEANGYGNYIFLRDDNGNEAVYGHLSRIQVGSGRVSEGQQIGLSGTTGNSTGCHLHFGYRPVGYNRNNGFLGYINPTFNAGTPAGGEDMMNQGENEYARANKLHLQVRGRGLDRAVFNQLAGKITWLRYIEILSDDPEADNWQENGKVGAVARRDRWDNQIYTLQDQLKKATDLVNALNDRLVKSENTTKALTEKVDQLNAKVAELDSPDNLVVSRNRFNSIFDAIKNFFNKQ